MNDMGAVDLEKIDEKLSAQGWFLSTEGLEQITQNGNLSDLRAVTQIALDSDLKEIGKAVLSEQIARKLIDNVVLQIQKTKNISAPKANEDSQAAPRMLKMNLTDGHAHCQAIEIDNIGGLSLHKTAPGTKLLLRNAPVLNGFVFLKPEMVVVLGGKVAHLYEKWEVNKNMSNVKRGASDTDGPPAWVNFGRKIAGSEVKDFKSLEDKTSKEDGKPTEFDVQRNVAIAEASTTGALKKVFGGGTKPLLNEKLDSYGNKREAREPKVGREVREPRERNSKPERRNKREAKSGKDDVVQAKPSDKVSLFAFLEDKLPEAPFVQQAPLAAQPPQQKPYNNHNQRSNARNAPQFDRHEKSYNNPKHAVHYSNDYGKSNSYPNQTDFKSSSSYPRENRRGNNQPPRLQNKPVHQPAPTPHYNHSPQQQQQQQYQQFPPVQHFHSPPLVDDLASKMDRLNVNASFAKNAFKQHLNLSNASVAPRSSAADDYDDEFATKFKFDSSYAQSSYFDDGAPKPWKWNVGDFCMAKYWEDNKYYNATITGLTPKTCVVRFNEYGNMEEVLLEDCLPVLADDAAQAPRKGSKLANGNEYRGDRAFVNRNRRH